MKNVKEFFQFALSLKIVKEMLKYRVKEVLKYYLKYRAENVKNGVKI